MNPNMNNLPTVLNAPCFLTRGDTMAYGWRRGLVEVNGAVWGTLGREDRNSVPGYACFCPSDLEIGTVIAQIPI